MSVPSPSMFRLPSTPQNRKAAEVFRRLPAALLAARGAGALDDAEDLVLAHDEVLLAVDLDLRAAVLAEEHAVAGPHVQRLARAVLTDLAVADGDHLALLRLLLGRVGDDDAAAHLLAFLDALQDHSVVQGFDVRSHKAPFRLSHDVWWFSL